MNTFIWLLLPLSLVAVNANAEVNGKRLPNQMTIYGHQDQINVVHPDGSTSGVDQLGDLVTTSGALKDESGAVIGTYQTQKTLIGFKGTSAVRSNLVYYNITAQTKPKLNGDLYVEGVNTTTPGQTHSVKTLRPILGGTLDFAGSKGTAETTFIDDSSTDFKAIFTFYR
jgi:hypothetical protein